MDDWKGLSNNTTMAKDQEDSKMSDKKRPLVLWSGGLDSTALVIDLLHKGDIDVMYVDLWNNYYLQKHEKKAVTKLKAIIADSGVKGRIVEEHTFGYHSFYPTKNVYAQPALWLSAAVYLADPKHHSGVYIAYVSHDDAWHFKREITDAYDALNNLVCDGVKVPLEFPYEWMSKKQLLDNMKDFVYYTEVTNLIRYCESEQKEPCGECNSCKRHILETVYAD